MRGIFFAFLTVVAWAAYMLILRGAMEVWPVGLAGTLSRGLAGVLLGVFVCATGRGWRRLLPNGVGYWLLLMGAFAIVANVFWFAGLKWTSATNASLVLRVDLLFVVLIGTVLGLERISVRGLLTIPVLLVGLALLMEAHKLDWTGHLLGDVMTVTAALAIASNAFIIRRIMQRMDEQAVTFYNLLLSLVGFGALAWYEGWTIPRAVAVHPQAWWWLVTLAILTAVSTPFYYCALRRMMVWKLRAFLLLNPLMVALAEWALWKTHLNRLQWVGAALLLGGVLVLVWDEARSNLECPSTKPTFPTPRESLSDEKSSLSVKVEDPAA